MRKRRKKTSVVTTWSADDDNERESSIMPGSKCSRKKESSKNNNNLSVKFYFYLVTSTSTACQRLAHHCCFPCCFLGARLPSPARASRGRGAWTNGREEDLVLNERVSKRKNQYGYRLRESNLLYCVLGETFCNN
jgi:hypothetical protein